MAAPAAPTTTYAALALLALRPWTGYELTQQFQRSLAFCWPKAESVLYEEPRRLVRLGWANSDREVVNGRRRTRYTITADGRAALAGWLAQPSDAPRLELEPMLRLLFSDQGTVADAHRAVGAMRAWANANLAGGVPVVAEFLATGGPFPRRNHLSVLFASLFADLYDATVAWCDRADAEIATWPRTDGVGMTPGTRRLAQRIIDDHPDHQGH